MGHRLTLELQEFWRKATQALPIVQPFHYDNVPEYCSGSVWVPHRKVFQVPLQWSRMMAVMLFSPWRLAFGTQRVSVRCLNKCENGYSVQWAVLLLLYYTYYPWRYTYIYLSMEVL
jgi:hypothetical protein